MNQHLERLDGVAPFLRLPVLRFLELAKQKLGLTLLVVHGFRSVQQQLGLYQQGRRFDREAGIWVIDDQAQVVTNAKPGGSGHNVIEKVTGQPAAVAVDLVPLDERGQPVWMTDDRTWDRLYEVGWKVGLDPLGDSVGAYLPTDKGHWEEPGWKLKLEGLGLMLPAVDLSQV